MTILDTLSLSAMVHDLRNGRGDAPLQAGDLAVTGAGICRVEVDDSNHISLRVLLLDEANEAAVMARLN